MLAFFSKVTLAIQGLHVDIILICSQSGGFALVEFRGVRFKALNKNARKQLSLTNIVLIKR
ncbi:hypothetical protein PflCFBP13517_23035 [Pseudomonas fluorescens]|nr:hypothetical protein PflCFBP13517_23035 [Pseudomonas fluorescens]